jgi:hypothetical protein
MAIAAVSSGVVFQPLPPRIQTPTADDGTSASSASTQSSSTTSQQQAASAVQAASVRNTFGVPASDLGGPAGIQDALGRASSAQGNAQAQDQAAQDQAQTASTNTSPLTSAAATAAAATQSAGFLAYGANGTAQDYGSGLPRGNSYNAIA